MYNIESQDLIFTPAGVRLRRYSQRMGNPNWLLVPGGPGLGSGYMSSLADVISVPGTIWLVDLPGDGSNIKHTEHNSECFKHWPDVLSEAACHLPDCIFVGHSTGGMYLLSTPQIEQNIRGLVLISSAPDAGWRKEFARMAANNPLPRMEQAAKMYNEQKTVECLKELTVASTDWNFTKEGLDRGHTLLEAMEYNIEAMEWSEANFDDIYSAKWWPDRVPVMIMCGEQDRLISPSVWNLPKYNGQNIIRANISGAGHFPWVEKPEEVNRAFSDFASIL